MTALEPAAAEVRASEESPSASGQRVLVGVMAAETMLGIRLDAVAAVGMQTTALVDLVNARLTELGMARLSAPPTPTGSAARGRWALCWVDGTPLRANRALAEQGVLDGARLWLRFVPDDEARIPVVEHVTSAIPAELRKHWAAVDSAWAARVGATLLTATVLTALGLLVRYRDAGSGWLATAVATVVAVAFLAASTVLAVRPGGAGTDPAAGPQRRTPRMVADVLRCNGIAALAVGLGAAVPGPVGAPQVALAAAVIAAGAALTLRFFGGPLAVCTAALLLAAVVLVAAIARMVALTSATTLLCVLLLVSTLGLKRSPTLARQAARLRLPVFPSASGRWVFETRVDLPAAVVVAAGEDPELDGPQSVRDTVIATDKARNVLTGLLVGWAVVLVVCCGWLCDPTRDQRALAVTFAAILAAAVLLHARGYEDRIHATILAVAAVAVPAVIAVRYAWQLPGAATVLVACAVLILLPALGLLVVAVVPRTTFNPGVKLAVEWVGYLLFFAAFPVAFWLMGVFAAIRYRS